jgi:hypothetical protein
MNTSEMIAAIDVDPMRTETMAQRIKRETMPAPPVVIKIEQQWIAVIDAEISRLPQARSVLAGTGTATQSGSRKRKLVMSVEARARISAGQKKTSAQQFWLRNFFSCFVVLPLFQ